MQGNSATTIIPFSIIDECEVFGVLEESTLLLTSAQIDLFAVDQNGDGIIDEAEFIAKPGADGDITANIIDNGDGSYLFIGDYPIINEEEDLQHAIRILTEDNCGNQGSEIIQFDVLLQEEPDGVGAIFEMNTSLVLYQNRPNPFKREIIISFYIPESNEMTIEFRDLTGRVIYTINSHYLAGFNEVFITKTMLEGISGVVTYTLKNDEFAATRKMIVHE